MKVRFLSTLGLTELRLTVGGVIGPPPLLLRAMLSTLT